MSSISFDMDLKKGSDYSQLLTENKTLASELKQCQADKEFVWSLWKRLQVSNPDVTEAISLVIQREKEKSEDKDLKVLEILQIKDDRIEELQNIVSKQSSEISDLLTKKVDLQEQTGRFHAECEQLKDKLSTSQVQIKSLEAKERSIDDIHRQTITTTEREKHEFQRRITELSTELEVVRAEKADSLSKRIDLENKIRTLDREVSDKVTKFQGLVRELEEANLKLQGFEENGRQQQREISYKNRELENVRKELSELWVSHNQLTDHASQQAELIRQLQYLQQDTQKMLQNQESAFSMESTSLQQMYTDLSARYEASKKTETELRQEMLQLKQDVLEKDDQIAQLQDPPSPSLSRRGRGMDSLNGSYLDTQRGDVMTPVVDWEYKVEMMQREVDALRQRLHEKEVTIRELNEQSLEFDVSRLNKHERTHSTPSREVHSTSPKTTPRLRSRSASPSRESQRQYCTIKKKLQDTEHLLDLKSRELVELRKAHAKRLERLRSVQNSYKLVKEELQTLEGETFGGKRKPKTRRSHPRDLQKEDSDQVWNELTHFRNENRSLVAERLALQEELDMLRVQAAQDAALIHELNLKLEQTADDLDFNKRKRDYEVKSKQDLSSEVTILKSSVQSKDVVCERLEGQLRDVTVERDRLMAEWRELKSEVSHSKQECSRQRIEIANLKHDIHRLQRDLEESTQLHTSRETSVPLSDAGDKSHESAGEMKPVKLQPRLPVSKIRRRAKTNLVRKYQGSLNKSIEKMRSLFSNFTEEGWEEITDNLTTEEETLTESDTLGRSIVTRSRTSLVSTGSESGTARRPANNMLRLRKSKLMKTQAHKSTRREVGVSVSPPVTISESKESVTSNTSTDTGHRVVLREMATSPIPFSSPSKERVKKSRFQTVSPAMRQLGSLKQRVGHLQQQITTLRDSRGSALKTLSEQKEANQQSQSDLNLANQRLRLAKQNVQKLTGEVERLQKDKVELEHQLSARDETSSTLNTLQDRHNEQEWKVLETRLKVSSNELSRQSATIRTLKTENEGLQTQIKTLQDKVNHVERDNTQKRSLLESQRTKLKQVQDMAKTDADRITDLETKLRLVTESHDKMKTQVEAYRKRLGVSLKEKQESEDKYCKAVLEVERKTKLYCESKSKMVELEETLSELENTAKQQLHGLATQSEAAIDAAQEQLTNAHNRIQQYQTFVRALGKELVLRVERTKHQVREHLQRRERSSHPVDFSLQKAQNVARNILNLSQSDLEDIMSADGDVETEPDVVSEAEKKNNRRWMKKCDKMLSSKDFVLSLVNHFLQKVDERGELLLQLQAPSS